jgi:hypothetical protein
MRSTPAVRRSTFANGREQNGRDVERRTVTRPTLPESQATASSEGCGVDVPAYASALRLHLRPRRAAKQRRRHGHGTVTAVRDSDVRSAQRLLLDAARRGDSTPGGPAAAERASGSEDAREQAAQSGAGHRSRDEHGANSALRDSYVRSSQRVLLDTARRGDRRPQAATAAASATGSEAAGHPRRLLTTFSPLTDPDRRPHPLSGERGSESSQIVRTTSSRSSKRATENATYSSFRESPLTDSNRRHPGSHRQTRDLSPEPVPVKERLDVVSLDPSADYTAALSGILARSSASLMVSLRPASVARATSSAESAARARSTNAGPGVSSV